MTHTVTDTAVATSIVVTGVEVAVLMPARTMSFSARVSTGEASADIHGLSDGLEVPGVDAAAHAAEVVDDQAFGQWPAPAIPRPAMRVGGGSRVAVKVPVPIVIETALPQPAGIRVDGLARQFPKLEALDLGSIVDLRHEVTSRVVKRAPVSAVRPHPLYRVKAAR